MQTSVTTLKNWIFLLFERKKYVYFEMLEHYTVKPGYYI